MCVHVCWCWCWCWCMRVCAILHNFERCNLFLFFYAKGKKTPFHFVNKIHCRVQAKAHQSRMQRPSKVCRVSFTALRAKCMCACVCVCVCVRVCVCGLSEDSNSFQCKLFTRFCSRSVLKCEDGAVLHLKAFDFSKRVSNLSTLKHTHTNYTSHANVKTENII